MSDGQRLPAHPQLRWADMRPSGRSTRWSDLDVPAERFLPTHNGRGAIFQALRARRVVCGSRDVVLVPAFHCPTVVDPVLDAGFRVRFYAVDERLRIDEADFLDKLDGGVTAAIVIRYFGIADVGVRIATAVRDSGAWLIDDCSHSFLRGNPPRLAHRGADATTYSFWKLLPSVDGGGVLFGGAEARRSAAPQSAAPLGALAGSARTMLGQLLDGPHGIVKSGLVGMRLRAPERRPTPSPVARRSAREAYPYSAEESRRGMSPLARALLRSADLGNVVTRRRENYAALAQTLDAGTEMQPLWPTLDDASCPWGFPVLLAERHARDYLIRDRGVPLFTFGEVLHPLLFEPGAIGPRGLEVSCYLRDTMLVLSIHQGLTVDQVRSAARSVNAFLSECGGTQARTHA